MAKPKTRPDVGRWHHHFLGGLINGSKDLDVGSVCPGGQKAVYVRTEIAWYQFSISGLSSGLYTPARDEVWCEPVESDG